jgi:hypothetical protein
MASKSKLEDFTSFWKHYELVQTWVAVNKEARETAVRNLEWNRAEDEVNDLLNKMKTHTDWNKTEQNNLMLNQVPEPSTSKSEEFSKRKISESTNGDKSKKKKKRRSRNRKSTTSSGRAESPEMEIDIEMDEEMVEFFRISMEHRKASKILSKVRFILGLLGETQRLLEMSENQQQSGHWIRLDENEYVMDTDGEYFAPPPMGGGRPVERAGFRGWPPSKNFGKIIRVPFLRFFEKNFQNFEQKKVLT